MSKDIDVLGIGNAIMDIIAPVPDNFLTIHKMDKGSMALVDEKTALALNDALNDVKDARGQAEEFAGGSAANTMVGIAELGVSGAYIGKVGHDDVGQRMIQGYQAAGIEFQTAPTKSGTASARCMIAVTPDGERTMNTFLGANADFSVPDIDLDMIARAKTIYLEGYLFDADSQKEGFIHAAKHAKKQGCKVALTLSDSFCVGRHRKDFLALVEDQVDILFANEDEIMALFETERLDTALDALTSTKTTSCITRGEEGSVIQTPQRRYHVLAIPVHKVVDTTGAGDQYAAGVLAGRAMGKDWDEAGYLGSLCAAEVIGHYGPRPSGLSVSSPHKGQVCPRPYRPHLHNKS